MPAAKLYMKLTGKQSGPIKGESRVANYRDQIELIDWKWQLKTSTGANSSQKVTEPGVLSCTKLMDRASTAMLGSMRNGEFLDAVIAMEDVSEERFELTLILENVLLTNYDFRTQTAEKDGEIQESWDLDYETVTFDYRATLREGLSSVKLKRPAGAATTNFEDDAKDKILAAARDLDLGKLEDVFKSIRDQLKAEATSARDALTERYQKQRKKQEQPDADG